MSKWTEEQREKAAVLLLERMESDQGIYRLDGYGYEAWAIDLQADHTRCTELLKRLVTATSDQDAPPDDVASACHAIAREFEGK